MVDAVDPPEVITIEDPAPVEDTVAVAEEDGEVEVDNSEVNVEVEPTVIVETPADNSASDVVIEHAIDQEGRLVALEGQMGALVGEMANLAARLDETAFRQEMTEEVITEQAAEQEAIGDAVAETVAEDLELDADGDPDTPPSSAKRHWFFQSWKELRGKN